MTDEDMGKIDQENAASGKKTPGPARDATVRRPKGASLMLQKPKYPGNYRREFKK